MRSRPRSSWPGYNNVGKLSRRAWLEQTQSEAALNNLQKGTIRRVSCPRRQLRRVRRSGGVGRSACLLSWKLISTTRPRCPAETRSPPRCSDVDNRERALLLSRRLRTAAALSPALTRSGADRALSLVPFGCPRVEEGHLVHLPSVEVPDRVAAAARRSHACRVTTTWSAGVGSRCRSASHRGPRPGEVRHGRQLPRAGNHQIFPRGLDAETNEWLEGFERRRMEARRRGRRTKMHTVRRWRSSPPPRLDAARRQRHRRKDRGDRPATPSYAALCATAALMQPGSPMLLSG